MHIHKKYIFVSSEETTETRSPFIIVAAFRDLSIHTITKIPRLNTSALMGNLGHYELRLEALAAAHAFHVFSNKLAVLREHHAQMC